MTVLNNMTRNGDSNGDGPAQRRWHQKSMMLPAATILILMGAAFGYGQIAALGVSNAERIDQLEERTVSALEGINSRLDQLFQPRVARRQ